jgi:hypothetical protein
MSRISPFLFVKTQTAALVCVKNIAEQYLDEQTARKMVLPRAKATWEAYIGGTGTSLDMQLIQAALHAVHALLPKLERVQILDDVLPLLWDVRLQDPDVLDAVVREFYLFYFIFCAQRKPFTCSSTFSYYATPFSSSTNLLHETCTKVSF